MKEAFLDVQVWCYCLTAFCTTLPTSGLGAFANVRPCLSPPKLLEDHTTDLIKDHNNGIRLFSFAVRIKQLKATYNS
jgi:hypothetical protein